MKTRAAIMRGTGQDWEVTELELDPPKVGEVLVRFVASGLCHSDEHIRTGDLIPRFPIVGGHEGAGVVEEVGPGVTRLEGRRPHRLLVPAGVRALPLVLDRQLQPVRPRRHDPGRLPDRRHVPVPHRRRRGRGRHVHARHVLGVRDGIRAVVREGRRRPAPRQAGADRLRRAHRLGLRRARGGGRARRHHRDLRHRRHRHQLGAGRGAGWRAERGRDRSGRHEARGRRAARRHAQLRHRRARPRC